VEVSARVQASIATNATARKPIFNQKTPHFSPFFLYFRPKIGYNMRKLNIVSYSTPKSELPITNYGSPPANYHSPLTIYRSPLSLFVQNKPNLENRRN
jgi:hypothetical protein